MDKKVLSIITIFAVFILVILGIFVFFTKQSKTNNDDVNLSNTNSLEESINRIKDIVIIKNGNIENEQLIDEFIEKTNLRDAEIQELQIVQEDKRMKVTYTPGEISKLKSSSNVDDLNIENDGSYETRKRIYGYYTLIVDGEDKGEYVLPSHSIKRIVSNDTVILYFDAPLIEYVTIPEICRYSVKSSNYAKKISLVYNQRKDLGIKTIFDTGEYELKTFGGDVQAVIDGDMIYNLEDALNQKVINPDDILEQAKIDLKFGICEGRFFKDGGSIEYGYKDFTILKLNGLSGDKDFIIGMRGQIIDLYNKNK